MTAMEKAIYRALKGPLEQEMELEEFLRIMTERKELLNPEQFSVARYAKYSFACLIRKETKKEEMDQLREMENTILYWEPRGNMLLCVLYDLTGNFALLERKRKNLVEQEGFQAGILHHGLNGLWSSFLEACQVAYTSQLVGECQIFEEISSPTGQILKSQKIMEVERSIRTDLQFREGKNVLRYLHQWFEVNRSMGNDLNGIRYDSINLYASIKYTLFDMYDLKLKRIKAGREVHEILRIQTVEELELWFCTWFLYTLDNFDLLHANTGFQIQEVLSFLDNHIMDDLSLSTVASYFYVNASYFSTLFRQETGRTYISYVTELKMKKAMELLKEDFKVYETAHMLGYEDLHHFRNVFKKYHGVPPSKVKDVR